MDNIPTSSTDDKSAEFNWNDIEDCIVQQPRPKVAIYTNGNDDIVIRKEEEYGVDDGDIWIIISRDNAANVARAIMFFAEHPEDGRLAAPARTPVREVQRTESGADHTNGRRALTPAERQRRRREKKKHAHESRDQVTLPLLAAE